ncbi:MAG: response regulator transcription factor [Eubacteriaceae bacterium]|nr:response regulator transcription factor [Eubacteriaceae bacterium]
MIYVLEDDEDLCNLIAHSIRTVGHEAKAFYRPSDMYNAIKKKKPELIILDLMLPEENGITVLKKLRKDMSTEDIAIIILTAREEEYQMVHALESGADDYITKPFRATVLTARINALLRRTRPSSEGNVLKFKDLTLNPAARKVSMAGENVSLTTREFDLVCLLMRKKGKVLSRNYILSELWGEDAFVEERIIDSHIRSIRAKLGKCGQYIRSVRGVGYVMGESDD